MLFITFVACDDISVTNPQQDGAKIARKFSEAMKDRDYQKLNEAEQYMQEYIDAYAKAGRSGDEIKQLMDEAGKGL